MLGQREACLGNVAAARAAFTLGLRKCSGGVPLWAAAVATEEAAGNVYALHTHRTSHVAAKGGSLTTVSRSDIRLIQYLGSSALTLVRRWRVIGHFPIHFLPRINHADRNGVKCPDLRRHQLHLRFETSGLE